MNKKNVTPKKAGIIHWFFAGFIFPAIIGIPAIILLQTSMPNTDIDMFLNTNLGLLAAIVFGILSLALSTYISSLLINRWYFVSDAKRVATISTVIMVVIGTMGIVFSDQASTIDIVALCVQAAIFYIFSVLWINSNATVGAGRIQDPTI